MDGLSRLGWRTGASHWLGDISYPLFLAHGPVIIFVVSRQGCGPYGELWHSLVPLAGQLAADFIHEVNWRNKWRAGRKPLPLSGGIVSMTIASGAVGKTSLKIVEGLALATGRPLLGVDVPKLAVLILMGRRLFKVWVRPAVWLA